MALSVNLLKSKADCDVVLDELNKVSKNLDFRKVSLERSLGNATERSASLESDLATTQAEIASLVTIIAALPDGATKQEMQNRKTRADFKLFQIEQRKLSFGTTAVILYESQLGEITGRITAVGNDIAQVTAYKATI
jgi:hypothetical protein